MFDDNISLDDNFLDELLDYNKSSKINKDNYREDMSLLYDSLSDVTPIDSEINDYLYTDDYVEEGVSLNKENVPLKQIWTDYRLIYNEKNGEDKMAKSYVLDNFDLLYDNLSKKVDDFDKYMDSFNAIKKELDSNNSSREELELEKIKFENYKNEELARLSAKEKELNEKISKVNALIKRLDSKLNIM